MIGAASALRRSRISRETEFLRRVPKELFENGAGNKGRGRRIQRRLVIQRIPAVVSSIGSERKLFT